MTPPAKYSRAHVSVQLPDTTGLLIAGIYPEGRWWANRYRASLLEQTGNGETFHEALVDAGVPNPGELIAELFPIPANTTTPEPTS